MHTSTLPHPTLENTAARGAWVDANFPDGSIVQIKNSNAVGRVVETDSSIVVVKIFGEPNSNWGETNSIQSFAHGCLELMTSAKPPLDFEKTEFDVVRLLGGIELMRDIAFQHMGDANNPSEGFDQIELLASTFADKACEILDDLDKAY